MDWQLNEYDVFVVDYKIIIRENIQYKIQAYGIFFFACVIAIGIGCGYWSLKGQSIRWEGVVLIIGILIIIGIFSSKPKTVIEIDNEKKTIRVREKYDISRKNIVAIKVSSERGSNGYIYDYLSLVSSANNTTNVYHVIKTRFGNETYEVEQTAKIAKLIAESLGLSLLVETSK